MKVHDYEVSSGAEQACVDRMMRGDSFVLSDIVLIARECGVPDGDISYRLADRMIQFQRKAGKIRRFDGRWRAVL